MVRCQMAGAWLEHDSGEVTGSAIFSGLFAKSGLIFTISKSSSVESLLIRQVIRF